VRRAPCWLLFALLCMVLAAAAYAGGTRAPVRHEDPATVAIDSDPAAAFGWYLEALSRFAAWRFGEGRRLAVRLDQASLPPELRSIVREINELVVKEGSILEAADSWLRQAAALVDAGKIEAARPLLEQLSGYARRGEVLFDDLVAGFQELGGQSGVQALAPDAHQRRAYDELQRLAMRARAMLLAYRAAAQDPRSVAALGRLLPYATELDLAVPPLVHPGRAFAISGTVRERAPVPSKGRLLSLRLDDQTLAELPLGSFHQELVLPAGTLPGARRILAEVPRQGRYLGAQARVDFRAIQATPDLRVRTPGRVMAPGRLEVSGTAISGLGPAARAEIHAELGPAQGKARTRDDGTFTLALDLPGFPGIVGTEQVSVRLLPEEPWHAAVGLTVNVFVVNLVNAGLAAAVLVLGGGLAFAGLRRTPGRRRGAEPAGGERAATDAVLKVEAVPDIPDPVARTAAPGTPLRQAILDIYREALRAVQRATGLAMKPSTTLREFARAANPALGDGARAAFLGITRLAEMALYSHHPVHADLVEEARRLNARLGEEPGRAIS